MQWSSLRVVVCLGIALAAPATFGKTAEKGPEVQAVLLDHNAYPCVGCLFGVSDYYFCFAANDKILVGHDKVRTQAWWMKNPTNLTERGKTIPIRFDEKYIWAPGPNGKEIRMAQDYTKKIFMQNDRCQRAVK